MKKVDLAVNVHSVVSPQRETTSAPSVLLATLRVLDPQSASLVGKESIQTKVLRNANYVAQGQRLMPLRLAAMIVHQVSMREQVHPNVNHAVKVNTQWRGHQNVKNAAQEQSPTLLLLVAPPVPRACTPSPALRNA